MKNPIVIFGSRECSFCDRAKLFCLIRGYEIDYRDIGDPIARNEMLRRSPDAKTVPQIFIGDRHVGGYDDLLALPEIEILKLTSE